MAVAAAAAAADEVRKKLTAQTNKLSILFDIALFFTVIGSGDFIPRDDRHMTNDSGPSQGSGGRIMHPVKRWGKEDLH